MLPAPATTHTTQARRGIAPRLARHAARSLFLLSLAAAAVSLLGACALPGARASATPTPRAPTPTVVPPTPTNVPPGWVVFVGPHFTIAHPKDWTYANAAVPGNASGVSIVLQNASTGELITINETHGYDQTQLQALCKQGNSAVQLAGLPMRYTLDPGMDRTWYFVTSEQYAYALIALDAGEPQSVLAAHDAILATFRPDDPISGCVA